MNGIKMESIVTTLIHMPNGLAIDHKAQKLYWGDARLDKIERCNLDGSDRVVSIPLWLKPVLVSWGLGELTVFVLG